MTAPDRPADRIEIRGLRALGTHGALPEELGRAQPFEVDLDVESDLSAAASSDELADTVDYAEIAAAALEPVRKESFKLLERLAAAIAAGVLELDGVSGVTVTVRKLRPPLAADLASAGVRVTRGKPDASGGPR